jgi:nicotinate-nucleotide adenylyltransferase
MTGVGVLGGTFDPIHLGHIEAACAARQALSLEQVILVPSRLPPHRNVEPRASVFHRFAMAALAAGERDLTVSDLELLRDGPSYTALTLATLNREGIEPERLYFITGSDAFDEVATWYDYPRIFELANFVVVTRPGGPSASELARTVPGSPAGSRQMSIMSVEAVTPNVSSTDIRRRIGSGDPIDGLVPPRVADHIRRHRLYVPAPVAAGS